MYNQHFPFPLSILSEITLKKNATQYIAVLENREDGLSGIKDTNIQTHLHPCALMCVHTRKQQKIKLRRQKRQGEKRVQKLVLHKLLNGKSWRCINFEMI